MDGKYQNELWNLLFSDENLLDVTLNIIHSGEKIKEKIRKDLIRWKKARFGFHQERS